MPAVLTFTVDLAEGKSLELVTLAMVRRAMKRVMAEYLRLQRERIANGKDVDGKPFLPYSDRYAEAKARAGRNTSKPDLRLTGDMLRSQKAHVEVQGGMVEGVVEFEGAHPASGLRLRGKTRGGPMVARRTAGAGTTNANVAQAVDALRPFVGVSESERKQLADLFKQEILDAVAESVGSAKGHRKRS